MMSKSWNSYMNRKLMTRGFHRDQNDQILHYILGVIPWKVKAKIQIKNKHPLVKHQIEGPNVDEILRIRYPRKADELGIQWKQNKMIWT